jgi:hypothetical protein
MKFYPFVLFIIMMNVASFLLTANGITLGRSNLWVSPTAISSTFSLVVFAGWAAGGGLAGVIAAYLGKGVYAMGILLIWVIGIMFNVSGWILNGVGISISALIPPEYGVMSASIQLAINAIFSFIFFMFFVEMASQRSIS